MKNMYDQYFVPRKSCRFKRVAEVLYIVTIVWNLTVALPSRNIAQERLNIYYTAIEFDRCRILSLYSNNYVHSAK